MDAVTAEQAAEAAKGLTFEKVWAALMETRERMEASQKETQKMIQETQLMMQESQKKIDELSKNVGDVNNSFGRFTESLFAGGLDTLFNVHGYTFIGQGPHYKFKDKATRRVIAEADYFLEDGLYAMVVEVKTELKQMDIDDHLDRINTIRRHFDNRGDKRILVGAVAGGIVHKNVLNYALKQGLYVITQSGDSAVLAELPEGFKAREW